jgi:hypothetical protein
MVYDNLKAVVEAIFIGKERLFNRRFMALANHYRRFWPPPLHFDQR